MIGLISDTHGLLRPEVRTALKGCDLIIHAGDVGKPEILDELRAIAPLVAVKGNIDKGSWASQLPLTAVAEAGAFAVVMEMVPAELATQITGKLTVPTVGIGAGRNCDAQVLVWQDMAGLTSGKTAKFVKRFGDVGGELPRAATQYAEEVASGTFPDEDHSF